MSTQSGSNWDAESLQKFRIIGDRRYRRTWGTGALLVLIAQAGYGAWGVNFAERPIAFFLGFWGLFLATFCVVFSLALLDIWSVSMDYALRRRDLVRGFVHTSRAAAAPRNGDAAEPPPRL